MISLKVKDVREALRGFAKTGIKSAAMPILRHVRVTREGNQTTLRATDLDHALCYRVGEGEEGADTDLLVPYDTLRDVCKGRGINTLLSIKPDGPSPSIEVRDELAAVEVPYTPLPVKEYPPMPFNRHWETEVPAIGVAAILEAAPCASRDPHRAIIGTVLFDGANVVATDGKHLYRRNSLQCDVPAPVLIPADSPVTLLNPAIPALIQGGKDQRKDAAPIYQVVQGPWTWTFRSLDGKYPDFKQVIPSDLENHLRVILSDHDQALLDRLAKLPFTKEKDAPVSIRHVAGKLLLATGKGVDRRVYALQPSAILGSADLVVRFNFGFLHEATSLGLRTLYLKSGMDGLLLTDGPALYLFMPLSGADTDKKESWEPTGDISPVREKAELVSQPVAPSATQEEPEEGAPDNPKVGVVDHLTQLQEEASMLRDGLREAVSGLTNLIRTARAAAKEHQDLNREFSMVRRSIRALQSIDA